MTTCPCGHPELHLPQEGVDYINKGLDFLIEEVRKHLHVGTVPCNGLIEAMRKLNLESGIAVMAMERDQLHHNQVLKERAKNN